MTAARPLRAVSGDGTGWKDEASAGLPEARFTPSAFGGTTLKDFVSMPTLPFPSVDLR